MSIWNNIKNAGKSLAGITPLGIIQQRGNPRKHISNAILPIQFGRMRQDIGTWRDAISEAEQAYFPHRVKQQRMYIDQINNDHIAAAWERRKDLTLLREFELCNKAGKANKEWTEYFQSREYFDLTNYALDALGYGYTLIEMGNCVNNHFPELTITRRWNISPDRMIVGTIPYAVTGLKFNEPPYDTWHIWVPTPTEIGSQSCGYGLFYKTALLEIFMRNNRGHNANANELFGQPIRWGKTNKTEGEEYDALKEMLVNMGSSGWLLTDMSDELQLIESSMSAQGYKTYPDFEQRLQKGISKLFLGHADAIDSIPGKLGGGQGGNKDGNAASPVEKALIDKQTKDGQFIENIYNNQVLPKLRAIGIPIPEDLVYKFKNDAEQDAARKKEDETNQATAEVVSTLKLAGYEVDPTWITTRTNIPVTKVAAPAPPSFPPKPEDKPGAMQSKELTDRIKNKLNNLYRHGRH